MVIHGPIINNPDRFYRVRISLACVFIWYKHFRPTYLEIADLLERHHFDKGSSSIVEVERQYSNEAATDVQAVSSMHKMEGTNNRACTRARALTIV